MRNILLRFGLAMWGAVIGLGLMVHPAWGQTTAPVTSDINTVLILPLSVPTGANEQWIGKAVQQDLLTDLTQGTRARVLAPAIAAPPDDAAAALRAAHDAGATIVVFGQAQVVGSDLRLTGQVLDVTSGKPLAALKATGSSVQMFHLEDAIASQVLAALPRVMLTDAALQSVNQPTPTQTAPAPQTPYPPVTIYTDEPSYNIQSPPSCTVSPSYGGGDYGSYGTYSTPIYPYGSYGYPYGGFIIVGNGFHHHHDGFDHHLNGQGPRGRSSTFGQQGLIGIGGQGVHAGTVVRGAPPVPPRGAGIGIRGGGAGMSAGGSIGSGRR